MSKKIITPKRREPNIILNSVSESSQLDTMLTDAMTIVQREIARYSQKTGHGMQALNAQEAKILQGYLKTLVEISREQRAKIQDFDLEDMDTEEAITLLQVLIEKRKSNT